MDRIQRLLVPKYQEKNLKYPKHLRTDFPDSKKQESITKSGRIRGAHEILGLGGTAPTQASHQRWDTRFEGNLKGATPDGVVSYWLWMSGGYVRL